MITNINHTYRFYKRVLENSVAKFLKEDVLTQSAAFAGMTICSVSNCQSNKETQNEHV